MGSPISMVIANLVLEDVEDRIFASSDHYDVLYWRRYVDDTWIVLPKDNIEPFCEHINSIENSIQFTVEQEDKSCSLPFLDVLVSRSSPSNFSISLYSKPTCSRKYLAFSSYSPSCHKRAVVSCLSKRAQLFASSSAERDNQLRELADVLNVNGYPRPFVRSNIFVEKPTNLHVSSSRYITLPYVKDTSEAIRRILKKHNISVAFKPIHKLKHFFPLPKDKVDPSQRKGIVYKINCDDCNRPYIGQSGNCVNTRVEQHRAAFRLINPSRSAVAQHALEEGHRIDWSNVEILAKETNYTKRLFLESWFSKKFDNSLNRCDLNIPSFYFPLL